jgi:hypothetical protein
MTRPITTVFPVAFVARFCVARTRIHSDPTNTARPGWPNALRRESAQGQFTYRRRNMTLAWVV